MRTLLVCRGPIAFETREVYRRCNWQLPHVVISSREWIAERQRTAPWIADIPQTTCIISRSRTTVRRSSRSPGNTSSMRSIPDTAFWPKTLRSQRVRAAGLRFIGPTPETLRAVGDKDTAIPLAKHLGILTIPGDDTLVAFALRTAKNSSRRNGAADAGDGTTVSRLLLSASSIQPVGVARASACLARRTAARDGQEKS